VKILKKVYSFLFDHSSINSFFYHLDKRYIVKKTPYLINEMINIEAQLVAMGHAERCKNRFLLKEKIIFILFK
jgi:hypothetical protein